MFGTEIAKTSETVSGKNYKNSTETTKDLSKGKLFL